MMKKKYRDPIYSIYGFVRFADEIVDTFHDFDKGQLLCDFWGDTYKAIDSGISTNPVLHSFQRVVREYGIGKELIVAFLRSMAEDLYQSTYNADQYNNYIYGSAEVVGLMCLHVFYPSDKAEYQRLLPGARKLGQAFQKVNFMRDIQADYEEKGRTYFPDVDFNHFSEAQKKSIEEDIRKDFDEAYINVVQLIPEARMGVYLAYRYYTDLLKNITRTPASILMRKRIRVSDTRKFWLLFVCWFQNKFILKNN